MRTNGRGRQLALRMGAVTASLAIITAGCTGDTRTGTTTPSPGSSVAAAQPASEAPTSQVVFVDVRTRTVTPLPAALTAFDEASDFRRSPDGSRFLFRAAEEEGSTPQLYVGAVDGSSVRRLTDGEHSASSGRWSPDGSRVVFLSGGFLLSRLKVIEVATGDVQRVEGVERGVWEPSFSPDGRSILFSMATRAPQGSWRTDLWTVSAKGWRPDPPHPAWRLRRLLARWLHGRVPPDGRGRVLRQMLVGGDRSVVRRN
jgi:dipeptidyl aminopeptidase/acylaminoacyl peptidase